jgi:hypothetical protein
LVPLGVILLFIFPDYKHGDRVGFKKYWAFGGNNGWFLQHCTPGQPADKTIVIVFPPDPNAATNDDREEEKKQ